MIKTINRLLRRLWPLGLAAVVLAFGSCDTTVDAPHLVLDEYLENPMAMPAIVAGVRGEFANATSGGANLYIASALLTDELVHVGTFLGFRGWSDGIVRDDYTEANTVWNVMSRARWVAEDAVRRIEKWSREGLIPKASADTALARVSLYAGFANRVMGDHFDHAVIDGGPKQPREVFYERAIGYFDKVLALITDPANPLRQAAQGGKAQVHIALRQWPQALAAAAAVPTAFVYNAIHAITPARERNMIAWWANLREECSIWGTPFASWGLNTTPTGPGAIPTEGDPRVTYGITGRLGGDARRPFWWQLKFPGTPGYSMPVAIVKGTEMRLIEAEAAMRAGDRLGMARKINEVRTFHRTRPGGWPTLPLLSETAVAAMTIPAAWEVIMKERGIEMWLEGRRIGDLRRWAVEPGVAMVPFTVVREAAIGAPPAADPRRHVITSATPGLYLMVGKHEKDANPGAR